MVLSDHNRHAANILFKAPISISGDLQVVISEVCVCVGGLHSKVLIFNFIIVQVDGLLDNVNLEQLLSDRIKLDATETLSSSTIFDGVKVEGNIFRGGDNLNS